MQPSGCALREHVVPGSLDGLYPDVVPSWTGEGGHVVSGGPSLASRRAYPSESCLDEASRLVGSGQRRAAIAGILRPRQAEDTVPAEVATIGCDNLKHIRGVDGVLFARQPPSPEWRRRCSSGSIGGGASPAFTRLRESGAAEKAGTCKASSQPTHA